jgi:hypothetical protein
MQSRRNQKRISWQVSGKISRLKPFGDELHHGLENARIIEGYAYWVEEDYCSPPLAMERRSVLDRYFDVIPP